MTFENRRYHAQPDCCQLRPAGSYLDAAGRPCREMPLELARDALKAGKIVAVKGLGGFHLPAGQMTSSIIPGAAASKHRDDKPFALMCRDLEAARKVCVDLEERGEILTTRKPIVTVAKTVRVGAPERERFPSGFAALYAAACAAVRERTPTLLV